jgi:hypothetical protein
VAFFVFNLDAIALVTQRFRYRFNSFLCTVYMGYGPKVLVKQKTRRLAGF